MTLGFVVLQNHHQWREEDFEFARRFCRLLVVVCRLLLVACRLYLLLHVFEDRVCPSIAPDKHRHVIRHMLDVCWFFMVLP